MRTRTIGLVAAPILAVVLPLSAQDSPADGGSQPLIAPLFQPCDYAVESMISSTDLPAPPAFTSASSKLSEMLDRLLTSGSHAELPDWVELRVLASGVDAPELAVHRKSRMSWRPDGWVERIEGGRRDIVDACGVKVMFDHANRQMNVITELSFWCATPSGILDPLVPGVADLRFTPAPEAPADATIRCCETAVAEGATCRIWVLAKSAIPIAMLTHYRDGDATTFCRLRFDSTEGVLHVAESLFVHRSDSALRVRRHLVSDYRAGGAAAHDRIVLAPSYRIIDERCTPAIQYRSPWTAFPLRDALKPFIDFGDETAAKVGR